MTILSLKKTLKEYGFKPFILTGLKYFDSAYINDFDIYLIKSFSSKEEYSKDLSTIERYVDDLKKTNSKFTINLVILTNFKKDKDDNFLLDNNNFKTFFFLASSKQDEENFKSLLDSSTFAKLAGTIITLSAIDKMLNSLQKFYNKPNSIEAEIAKVYAFLAKNINADLEKLIIATFKKYSEQLKVNVVALNRETRRLIESKIKGRNIFDRLARNEKNLIISLKNVLSKQDLKDKTKIASKIISKEFNSLKRIIKNTTHVVKEQAKDLFFDKAKKLINIKKQWTCIFRNSRDEHKKMHKQLADENGYFTAPSGEKTKSPGRFGVARLDINCNCFIKFLKV
jgi:hypothetical protein